MIFPPEKICVVAAFLICSIPVCAQRTSGDLFQRYSAPTKFSGKPVAPILRSHDERTFRTKIREGVAKGVVFAGHYSVPVWGCGSGCLQFAVVDAISGRVYIFPSSVSADREEGDRLTFHRDSKAIRIIGSLNEEKSADRWYVWDGKRLNLISEQPSRLIPESSPDQ